MCPDRGAGGSRWLTCSAVGCRVEGRAINTALGNASYQLHLISPGCPRPNSALIVQKSGLKPVHPSIHPDRGAGNHPEALAFHHQVPFLVFSKFKIVDMI